MQTYIDYHFSQLKSLLSSWIQTWQKRVKCSFNFQNAVQNTSVWAAGVIFTVYYLLTLF